MCLGQIRELRVIGRNSSFRFKGKTDDARAIGEALRVANVLEGSVRKAGDPRPHQRAAGRCRRRIASAGRRLTIAS